MGLRRHACARPRDRARRQCDASVARRVATSYGVSRGAAAARTVGGIMGAAAAPLCAAALPVAPREGLRSYERRLQTAGDT